MTRLITGRRRWPRPLGTLLLDCVRAADDPGAAPLDARDPSPDPELLLEAATWHRIPGTVAVATRGATWLPASTWRTLERARSDALVRHLVAAAELQRIDAVLSEAQVPWVTFKGAVLAGTAYHRPDLRSSVDIDVLVPPRHAAGALTALEAAGYRCTDEDWCQLRADGAAEVALLAPSGMGVDLHWGLISDVATRLEFTIPTDELVCRARRVPLGSGSIPTLAPAETLVHLALHAALGGGNRIVWLADIDHVVRSQRPAWDDVVRVARSWAAGAAAALMLGRARRHLATPVPDDVLKLLSRSRSWLLLDAGAAAVAPVPTLAAEVSLPRLVARAARDDGVTSARALVRHSGLAVFRRGARRVRMDGTPVPSADAGALGDPVAQAQARASLFEAVAGAGWV